MDFSLLLAFFNRPKRMSTDLNRRCTVGNYISRPNFPSHPWSYYSPFKSWSTLLRAFLALYLVIGIVRLAVNSYVLSFNSQYRQPYLYYDITIAYTNSLKLNNAIASFCFMPFPLLPLYLDYAVNIKRYNYIPRLGHDLIVVNSLNFFALNPHLKPTVDLFRPIESVFCLFRILKWLVNLPGRSRVSFQVSRLKYLPINLSPRTRIQSILVLLLYQAWMASVLGVTAMLSIPVGGYYLFVELLPISPTLLTHFFAFIDITALALLLYRGAECLFFLFCNLVLLSFAYHQYIKKMSSSLKDSLKKTAKGQLPVEKLMKEVAFFCGQITLALTHLINANRYLVSEMLVACFASNFTVNIYFITSVYFFDTGFLERVIISNVLGFQLLWVLLAMQPMLFLVRDLYQPAGSYRVIQSYLNHKSRRYLGYKLKMMFFYELFNTTNQFTFTLGVFGKVTSGSVVEFLAFYSGCLMMVFGMIQEQLVKQQKQKQL